MLRFLNKPSESLQKWVTTCTVIILFVGKNLHSHHFKSPLSHNIEVSAFGEAGSGDEGDHWALQCSGKYWRRNDNVRLKHIVTEK